MKRATVTITDELEEALEAYRRDVEVPPGVSAVMQAALREFLAGRGYVRSRDGGDSGGPEDRPWPSYPLFDSGDPAFAGSDEEALAGGPGAPPFGEH